VDKPARAAPAASEAGTAAARAFWRAWYTGDIRIIADMSTPDDHDELALAFDRFACERIEEHRETESKSTGLAYVDGVAKGREEAALLCEKWADSVRELVEANGPLQAMAAECCARGIREGNWKQAAIIDAKTGRKL